MASAALVALPVVGVGASPASAVVDSYAWVGTAVMPPSGSFTMPSSSQETTSAQAAQYGNLFASATPRAQRPTSAVQLGDSYASGEGAFTYISNTANTQQYRINPGTPATLSTSTGENSCHRSPYAAIFSVGGVDHRYNLACSGAESEDIFGYNSQQNGTELPQAYQLARVASTTNVKLIAVGLGGNDLGFADVLNYCVAQWIGVGQRCRHNTEDRMTYGGKPNVLAGIVQNFSVGVFNTPPKGERPLDSNGSVAGARQRLVTVIGKIRSMMQSLGYADADYQIVLEGYMGLTASPAANASLFTSGRDPQCTLYGEDANYFAIRGVARFNAMIYDAANDLRAAGLGNVRFLNNHKASQGGERCRKNASSSSFVVNGIPLTGGNERGHPNIAGHQRVGACLNSMFATASNANWAWGCTVTTISSQPARPNVPSFP